MTVDDLTRIVMNFYHTHTIAAICVLAGLGILLLIKPKPVLKTIGVLVALCVVGYILYLLFDALFSGISGKKTIIHKFD